MPAQKDEQRVPVSGEMVITKTTDLGATLRTVRAGLPQAKSYDLVYRHALDVDATGDRLALGSTTGGLWVSEDGGESFTEVTHYLPPIACVRWG